MLKLKLQYFGHLMWKANSDTGKDWGQEEKRTAEDEMVREHHQLSEDEFEQTPGDGERQGSLMCCSPQGHKELDTAEWLNNNNMYEWTHMITCTHQHHQQTGLGTPVVLTQQNKWLCFWHTQKLSKNNSCSTTTTTTTNSTLPKKKPWEWTKVNEAGGYLLSKCWPCKLYGLKVDPIFPGVLNVAKVSLQSSKQEWIRLSLQGHILLMTFLFSQHFLMILIIYGLKPRPLSHTKPSPNLYSLASPYSALYANYAVTVQAVQQITI